MECQNAGTFHRVSPLLTSQHRVQTDLGGAEPGALPLRVRGARRRGRVLQRAKLVLSQIRRSSRSASVSVVMLLGF